MNSWKKKVPKKIVKSESESKLESSAERLAFGSNPSEVISKTIKWAETAEPSTDGTQL
jgi:hypothetical protein